MCRQGHVCCISRSPEPSGLFSLHLPPLRTVFSGQDTTLHSQAFGLGSPFLVTACAPVSPSPEPRASGVPLSWGLAGTLRSGRCRRRGTLRRGSSPSPAAPALPLLPGPRGPHPARSGLRPWEVVWTLCPSLIAAGALFQRNLWSPQTPAWWPSQGKVSQRARLRPNAPISTAVLDYLLQ